MKAFKYLFVALLAVGVLAGCDSNPAGDEDSEHSDEVAGLVLKLNGQTVVTVANGSVSGEIKVAPGEETALIRVEFQSEDGDEIHDADLSDDFWLDQEVGNESIATFEQHDEDGRWGFHIHGEAVGETTIELKLMHVDHADFRTPPIPIHVEE